MNCIVYSSDITPFQAASEETNFFESAGEKIEETLKNSISDPITNSVQFDCKNAVGYLAVYRLCFIVTLFFGLFSGTWLG